jgi:hypothetical protein
MFAAWRRRPRAAAHVAARAHAPLPAGGRRERGSGCRAPAAVRVTRQQHCW